MLPLLAGLAVMGWFMAGLDLDWAALFHGDLNAGTLALRSAAERQGALKELSLVAMIAFLPFMLVPISLVLLATAMVLSPGRAVAAILAGTFINTVFSHSAGRIWGGRALELFGLQDARMMRVLRQGAREHGFKFALFSRCMPVPFCVPGVAAALVGIGFWEMLAATAIMMLPWSLIYVFFTESLRRGDARFLGPMVAALAALGFTTWWIRRLGREEGEAPEGLLSPQSPPLGPELTLYTLPGHDASADARRELWALRPRLKFELREIDLSSDPALLSQYQDHAPLLFMGSRRLFSFQIDENALETYLKGKA